MSKSLILVHGLFMKPLVMKFLEWHFKKLGYTTYQFAHPSREFSETTLHSLTALIDSMTTDECYMVGHSMGGLIAKQVLQEHALDGSIVSKRWGWSLWGHLIKPVA